MLFRSQVNFFFLPLYIARPWLLNYTVFFPHPNVKLISAKSSILPCFTAILTLSATFPDVAQYAKCKSRTGSWNGGRSKSPGSFQLFLIFKMHRNFHNGYVCISAFFQHHCYSFPQPYVGDVIIIYILQMGQLSS